MIREMRTHHVNSDGQCVRCNDRVAIPTHGIRSHQIVDGHSLLLIGRISADFGGTRTYFIGEHDSNQLCAEVRP